MVRNPLFHLLLIAVLGLLVYSNTFGVPFQFDDVHRIANNPAVKDFKCNIFMLRQVSYVTFALNYAFGGTDVTGYHAGNLLIHIITAMLVYWLVGLTFRTPLMEGSSLREKSGYVALSAGLLFVCHPIQTQAVTYIVQRFASLATMFYLFSLVLYIKYRLGTTRSPSPLKGGGGMAGSVLLYFASLLFALLAMKSKETAFTLPLAIVLYEFMFFRGGLKKRLLHLGPLFLTILIIPLTLVSLKVSPGEVLERITEATRVHTGMSRLEYLFTEFSVITTYVRLLFLPVGQNLDYDYPLYSSFFEPQVFLSFLFLSGILGLGIYMLGRSRVTDYSSEFGGVTDPRDRSSEMHSSRGRSELNMIGSSTRITDYSSRLIAFGIFWFFLTLSVESSIIPIVDVINEHRVYLPSVGAFLAVVSAAFLVVHKLKDIRARRAALGASIVVILVLSGAAYSRNAVWRSETSLWEDVVRKSPEKARGHNNLGNSYLIIGDMDRAIKEYDTVLMLDPEHREAHYNLGNAYYRMVRMDKAIENYTLALKRLPGSAVVHFGLAEAYKSSGRIDRAIEHYRAAIKLKPDYPKAHFGLGTVYYWKDSPRKARREFKAVLALEPDNAAARQFLDEYLRQ